MCYVLIVLSNQARAFVRKVGMCGCVCLSLHPQAIIKAFYMK